MERQVRKIGLLIVSIFSIGVLIAAEPATIRLSVDGSLPEAPVVKYAELYLGPVTEIQWSAAATEGLAVTLERPRIVSLEMAGETVSLYLRPGDELTLSLTKSVSLKSLTFGNTTADANNRFFLDYQSEFKDVLNPNNVKTRVAQQPLIDEYEFALFDQAKKLKQYIDEYEDKSSISEDFAEFLTQEPRYFYWSRMFAHPIYQSQAGLLGIPSIPRVMYENFDAGILQTGSLNSTEYQQLVRFYSVFATAESNGFQKFETLEFLQKFYEVNSELLRGETLGFAISNILLKNGATLPPSGIRSTFLKLQNIPEAGSYAALVESTLSDRMRAKEEEPKKVKAKVTHDVEFFDEKGKPVGLEKFAGKVVYVDFWASWCGPCRRQFPYTKEMKSRFSSQELKQIVFLYISIDRDEVTWQNAVEKLGLEGEHLFSPGGWRSDACAYFGINSIPRYMILDKEGEIVYPNAPRPSSPETLGILKRLISE